MLEKRSSLRTALRIEYPGLCAFYYELVQEIIIEEVVGWDLQKKEARREGGLFGIPLAFSCSAEEQGRSTVHMHLQVWLKDFRDVRENLYLRNIRESRAAEHLICRYVNSIASCKLVERSNCREAFPHIC